MLYFQVLFYIGSLLLLSYHCSQLIPDIYRTELVLGTSSHLWSSHSQVYLFNWTLECVLYTSIFFSFTFRGDRDTYLSHVITI